LHFEIVHPLGALSSFFVLGLGAKKLDRAISQTDQTLTIPLYQYAYWSTCDETKLKLDLKILSAQYIQAYLIVTNQKELSAALSTAGSSFFADDR